MAHEYPTGGRLPPPSPHVFMGHPYYPTMNEPPIFVNDDIRKVYEDGMRSLRRALERNEKKPSQEKRTMIKTDAELAQQQGTAKSLMATIDQLNPLLKQARKEGLRVRPRVDTALGGCRSIHLDIEMDLTKPEDDE